MQFVLPPSLPETGRLAGYVDALRDTLTPGCKDNIILARRLRARLPSAGVKVPTCYTDALRHDVATCVEVAALLIAIANYSGMEPDDVATRVLKSSGRRHLVAAANNSVIRSNSTSKVAPDTSQPELKRSNTAPAPNTTETRKPTNRESSTSGNNNLRVLNRSVMRRRNRRDESKSSTSIGATKSSSTLGNFTSGLTKKFNKSNNIAASTLSKKSSRSNVNSIISSKAASQGENGKNLSLPRNNNNGQMVANKSKRVEHEIKCTTMREQSLNIESHSQSAQSNPKYVGNAVARQKSTGKRVTTSSMQHQQQPVARRLFDNNNKNEDAEVLITPQKKTKGRAIAEMMSSPVTPAKSAELAELVNKLEMLFGGKSAANRTMKTARMIRRYLKLAGYQITDVQDKRLVIATSKCNELTPFLCLLANMVGAIPVKVAADILRAREMENEMTPTTTRTSRRRTLLNIMTPTKVRNTSFQSTKVNEVTTTEVQAPPTPPIETELTTSTTSTSVVKSEVKSEQVATNEEMRREEYGVRKFSFTESEGRNEQVASSTKKSNKQNVRKVRDFSSRMKRNIMRSETSDYDEEQMNEIRRLVLKARKIGMGKKTGLKQRVEVLEYQQKHTVSWPTVMCMTTVVAYAALFQFVVLN